ncbi:hypothetical protein ABT061_34925 [Streptosporangium sp. NPDC002544]|uniref:hypothetical protein n=1 Tax=Streptosporangium sp. NPDC002544 TaxID=3154538 RepID=UPI00331F4D55
MDDEGDATPEARGSQARAKAAGGEDGRVAAAGSGRIQAAGLVDQMGEFAVPRLVQVG